MMVVSICMIAYNEEKAIRNILHDIENQDYPPEFIDVVLINNHSQDNTEQVMQEFAKQKHKFRRVIVKTNRTCMQASGWNLAIKEAIGDVIIRVDAHASIPTDFVSKNMICIESGEDISGGPRPNIIDDPTPWKETLLLAESSMFGSSIAPYRRNQGKTYVKSMFHAAYRREVFDKAGTFNENLGRTEDNEIHYRMREAGYKLCFNPEIISYQHIRNSMGKMIKQKYANGYWIGLTSGVCPECLSIYHFIPFVFVLAIMITTVLSLILSISGYRNSSLNWLVITAYTLTAFMWIAYWTLAFIMTIIAVTGAKKEQRNITNIALPFLFFILHITYGIGTLAGFVKMPGWRKGLDNGANEKR